MPIKLNSVSGGSVTIQAQTNTAATTTLTAPAVNGNIVTTGDTGSITPSMLSSGGPYWSSSGLLGIGTISPVSALSVSGIIGVQSGSLLFPIQPMLTTPIGKTKVTFSCTGAIQSFVVPANVFNILVKLWGAGGGGGSSGGWVYGSRGGGGGHTVGVIPVIPGTTYYIVVGQGGQTNYAGGQTPNYGGGGGLYNNTDNRYSGAGGGYTGIFNSSSISQATAIMIAGGGGGGGSSRFSFGNYGGAGGGNSGEAGGSPFDGRSTSAGRPGTQLAGGAAGITQGTIGSAGSALQGGYGTSNAYGGGGGGGYFGGGGGGYYESYTMAGGGGGSGYINASLTSFAATFTGHQFRPALFDDNDLPKTFDGYNNWQHYSVGGEIVTSASQYTSTGGGGGFCCIYY